MEAKLFPLGNCSRQAITCSDPYIRPSTEGAFHSIGDSRTFESKRRTSEAAGNRLAVFGLGTSQGHGARGKCACGRSRFCGLLGIESSTAVFGRVFRLNFVQASRYSYSGWLTCTDRLLGCVSFRCCSMKSFVEGRQVSCTFWQLVVSNAGTAHDQRLCCRAKIVLPCFDFKLKCFLQQLLSIDLAPSSSKEHQRQQKISACRNSIA